MSSRYGSPSSSEEDPDSKLGHEALELLLSLLLLGRRISGPLVPHQWGHRRYAGMACTLAILFRDHPTGAGGISLLEFLAGGATTLQLPNSHSDSSAALCSRTL